jgi:hypothetical protein
MHRAGAADRRECRGKPSNPAVEINCTSAVPYSVTRYSVLDIAPDAKGVTLTVIY